MNELNTHTFQTITILIFSLLLVFSPIRAVVKYAEMKIIIREDGVQQSAKKTITGIVTDDQGETLPGANIQIKGSTRGVTTGLDGEYSIDVDEKDLLLVSYLGMQTKEIPVIGKKTFNIKLEPKVDELDEVTVVAFSKQKKESVISSISTVKPSELKVPSSNMTAALGGRIAGVISYQRSGEPGRDNTEFFIRGVTTFGYKASPLILIDNVELSAQDLARLQPDDIASFSIMKDANATALYGARGANGVILVSTKEGKEGKAQLNIRFENSFSAPISKIKTVDPVSYMKLHNEAVLTRNPLSPRPYSDLKIESTEKGLYPDMYPAVDWYDELFNNFTTNQRVNLNLNGGGKVVRYYVAATFNNDNGILKVDKRNNFNNNINLKRIQVRSNVNITVTPTTDLSVKMNGSFDDYSGPIDQGDVLYKKVMATNPVLFSKYYSPNDELMNTKHILFGNAGSGNYINPYADMVSGYKDYSTMVLVAQAELKQKLDFVTEGLDARLLISTTRDSYFDVNRFYNPFYYSLTYFDKETGRYGLNPLNPKTGTEYLNYNEGGKKINTAVYMEGAIDYNKTFAEKHALTGLLVFTLREYLSANSGSLQKSLPSRNLGLAGRFTYSFDSRYFAEVNFGFNGSERFAAKERYGFYPSAGIGWIVSNEKFWADLSQKVHKLKLKATYGLAGNDAIGDENDRFFYLSNVNMDDDKKSTIGFGNDFSYRPNGISIGRYANENITWETSKKMNLGIELGLFKDFEIQADYFTEKRSNILMDRKSIPSSVGFHAPLRANVGEASSHGFEVSLDANHSFNKYFWLSSRVNFTYATSKYEIYEEPNYKYSWLSRVGLPINQPIGLIAEGLFIDEAEIANSPRQTFGTVMPGDIRYKDINMDGVIDSEDRVPIGYPDAPNIIYGFGLSTGYKDFDFSFFFQGSAQSSFFIDLNATTPFIKNQDKALGGKDNNNAMLQVWADDYWSESNRNTYAKWPRLSDQPVENNRQLSTWFMHDGSYLRLKSVELGYTVPSAFTKKVGLQSFRLYLSALNLFTISKFKMWDPEMAGNGLGYPIQQVYNIGLNVNF